MPNIIKPKNFLISSIHRPARGKSANELAKVPINNNNMPMPKEKAKRVEIPNRGFLYLATNVNRTARGGVRHGEATLPEMTPNKKFRNNDRF
jgi:hypothetical protein